MLRSKYDSLHALCDGMKAFLAIDYPVRCTFDKESKEYGEDVIDGLPFSWGPEGVYVILLNKQTKYSGTVGRRFEIPPESFQIMDYEPIEVNDFDWRAYLPEKKRLREEDE